MSGVLNHTSFILGSEVSRFEDHFAAYCRAEYCVGTSSGTSAIHLALSAIGVAPGDEVITTAHTFTATAEGIWMAGGVPVFVDIDERTYNIDPNKIEAAISSRTRAILPVHLYGQPADMAPIMALAEKHNLAVVEDAAQAHGAEYRGQRVGSIGDIGIFSFYPGKNLGAYGDGGAAVTNNAQLAARMRLLRNHGRTTKYEHVELGYGYRLDALQAAILDVKLRHLERWTEERKERARRYRDSFQANTDVVTPYEQPDTRHVYHLYVIRTPQRDDLLAHLRERGIGAGIHYPLPLHLQPAYRRLGWGDVSLPVTERIAQEIVSLPLYPEMSEDQQSYITDTVLEYVAGRVPA